MNLKNNLTIVIPTYNEEKYITNTIESIAKQYNINGTKVIIADGFSKDNTRTIINNNIIKYKDILDIILIDGGKVATARNNGAKLSNTKYTLFIDADSIIMGEYNINNNIILMENNNLDLLTCKVKSYGENIRTVIGFKLFNIINKIISMDKPFAVGGYFMTNTYKFIQYGMFDESILQAEDYILSIKYDKHHFKIAEEFYGQDDRRFNQIGYTKMIFLLIQNYLNRNNIEYFKKDVGYWKD